VTASQLSTDPHCWLRQAHEDLAAAELLANDPAATPRHSCTFAYQAAEKALGATLVFLSIDVPLFRDLNALLELVPVDWQLRSKNADVAELSQWSIEA
jgi:HEPN domain-containing protein